MKKSDLIYGVSLGAAFFLTGINILAEEDLISFEIKISVGMIFVIFGLLLSIITLAWYITHGEDKMRNNKIRIGEQKYMLIGILIGLLGGFLGSMFANSLWGMVEQNGGNTMLILGGSAISFYAVVFVLWYFISTLDKSEREKEEKDNVERIMEGK